MKIGVPKEIKNHEYRVGLTPASAKELIDCGHSVTIETSAGEAIGFGDQEYTAVGAKIAGTAEDIFKSSDMIIKVKEPQLQECRMLSKGQILFTYLHLAPDPNQTGLLLDSGCTAIAYETVRDSAGTLPLLTPMSEIAGKLSVQLGANMLLKINGGSGLLIGGVPGTKAGNVTVIGGGIVGTNAAKIAIGLGANVTILDRSIPRLNRLQEIFQDRAETLYSNRSNLEYSISKADIIVGAVLIPGAAAPKLITREMLKMLKPSALLVDVAIDQGGCFETSKATTHRDPTFVVDGITHYCVANMPGAAPRTATDALNNATLPYALQLCNKGVKKALADDMGFAMGLNIHKGKLYEKNVAVAQNLKYTPLEEFFSEK